MEARFYPVLQQTLCLGFAGFWLGIDGKGTFLTGVTDSPVLTIKEKNVLLKVDSQEPQ